MKIYQRHKSPVLSRKEVKYAVGYFASLLMPRQLTKNLTIHLEFMGNCIDPESGNQLHADCLWLDTNLSPREFRIRINATIPWRKKQLQALAHEMTHVKQYASGEMRDVMRGPSNIKWKKEYVHETKIDYFFLPWEIEAYGRENGLYMRYLEHLRTEKIRFD